MVAPPAWSRGKITARSRHSSRIAPHRAAKATPRGAGHDHAVRSEPTATRRINVIRHSSFIIRQ